MYKSPIEVFITDIQHQVEKKMDDEIYLAVVSHNIHVDKEELLRALRYDRDQYEKGYADGKRDAMDELVRCKDCKYYEHPEYYGGGTKDVCRTFKRQMKDDDFCSYGERREGE